VAAAVDAAARAAAEKRPTRLLVVAAAERNEHESFRGPQSATGQFEEILLNKILPDLLTPM
jgi:hypothetical protein